MRTMRLRSHGIQLDLHPRFPAVVGYRLAGHGIRGDPQPGAPACRVWSPEARANLEAAEAGLDVACQVRREGSGVMYVVSLARAGEEAIRLVVRMGLEGSELVVRLEGVEERDAWQLVHVELWRLASAHTHEPESRLVIPTRGGRRIDPARSAPDRRVHAYNWMQEPFSQVGVVHDGPACAVLVLESLNDLMLSSVSDCAGGRAASFGVRMVHRMEAAGTGLQFQVHSPSAFRIKLLDTGVKDAAAGWVPAAAMVRERLGPPRTDPYRDRFVYKVFVGRPGSPAEVPFEQVIQGIRSRFHRTDGAAQVCYLVGFQHQGTTQATRMCSRPTRLRGVSSSSGALWRKPGPTTRS